MCLTTRAARAELLPTKMCASFGRRTPTSPTSVGATYSAFAPAEDSRRRTLERPLAVSAARHLPSILLTRYQQFLADYQKGTPVLFFIVAPVKRGAPNRTRIAELEEFLIQTGQAANPHLLNIKGTKAEEWGIAGVLRGGKGKRSSGAREFRRLMKLGEPSATDRAVEQALAKSGATSPDDDEISTQE